MAQGDIKPFWAKKQHGLCKLWFLFDNFGIIYLHYFAPFPHVPVIIQSSHYTKAWPWGVGPFSTLHDQHKKDHESRVMTWIGELLLLDLN